jgi:hypothetical protein
VNIKTHKIKQPTLKEASSLVGYLLIVVFSLPSKAFAASPNCTTRHCDLISTYVNPAINLFSVMFGLIAVISIILGGIQYSASEGDPQKASKAKNRIVNTIFAIFAYALLYGFLQFLVPGGFLHG